MARPGRPAHPPSSENHICQHGFCKFKRVVSPILLFRVVIGDKWVLLLSIEEHYERGKQGGQVHNALLDYSGYRVDVSGIEVSTEPRSIVERAQKLIEV